MPDRTIDLRVTADAVETDSGTLLLVAFAGNYPDGSQGNPTADRMKQAVAEAVAALPEPPAAVLFDMTELHYEWGDALLGVLAPLMRNVGSRSKPVPFWPPVAFAARGATRDALTTLGIAGGMVDVKLVETREAGVARLQERLEGSGSV